MHTLEHSAEDARNVAHQIETVEAVISLLLNIPLMIFIIKREKFRKQPSFKSFLSLQFVHVISAIALIAWFCYPHRYEVYIVYGIWVTMFLSLMLYTVDRLIVVKYPYKYLKIDTKHVTVAIISSWLPGLILTAVAVTLEPTIYYMIAISTALLIFAMIVLTSSNGILLKLARSHYTAIKRQCTPSYSKEGNGKRVKEKRNLKSVYVCVSIVMTFLAAWFPTLIRNFIYFKQKKFSHNDIVNATCEVIAVINSSVDPILFVLFRKDVKKEIKNHFKKKKGRPSIVTQSSVIHDAERASLNETKQL